MWPWENKKKEPKRLKEELYVLEVTYLINRGVAITDAVMKRGYSASKAEKMIKPTFARLRKITIDGVSADPKKKELGEKALKALEFLENDINRLAKEEEAEE